MNRTAFQRRQVDVCPPIFAVVLLALLTASPLLADWSSRGVCGDGVLDPGEECDPGFPEGGILPELQGKTCESEGYGAGDLSCTSGCELDRSTCYCESGVRLPATGQKTCWDINARVIDCAGTGHDGETRAGAPLSYTDNGDGTITDDNTGLMWEKKNDDGGIHDRDNRYTWRSAFYLIDSLNNTCEGDGFVRCDNDDYCGAGGRCGFAGYRDWRLPNIKELHGLVDYGRFPAVDPVFLEGCTKGCSDCSCISQSPYWSTTSVRGYAFDAWYVSLFWSDVNHCSKRIENRARAVRGGL